MLAFQDLYQRKENWSKIENKGEAERYIFCWLRVFIITLLWTFLLIVPGMIKGLAYSQTFYILRENPTMSPKMAMEMSENMMRGQKMDFFLFHLSFIGWYLLASLSAGIGFLFLLPYVQTSVAVYYEELKKSKMSNLVVE